LQDDWADWLTLAEFNHNNQVSKTMGFSPFFVTMGFHPRKGTEPRLEVPTEDATKFATQMCWKNVHGLPRLCPSNAVARHLACAGIAFQAHAKAAGGFQRWRRLATPLKDVQRLSPAFQDLLIRVHIR
jgi:hypothetical protein